MWNEVSNGKEWASLGGPKFRSIPIGAESFTVVHDPALLEPVQCGDREEHAAGVELVLGDVLAADFLEHSEAGVDAVLQQHAVDGVVGGPEEDVDAVDRVDKAVGAHRVGQEASGGDERGLRRRRDRRGCGRCRSRRPGGR